MKKRNQRYLHAVLAAVGVCAASQGVGAETISSIHVDLSSGMPAPLTYSYDAMSGGGVLTLALSSITAVVERQVGGQTVPEFYPGASFELTATGLTDISQPPLAAGSFSNVMFSLRDSGHLLLLGGSQPIGAGLIYGESLLPDRMVIGSQPLGITGGSLAADFNVAATLFGTAFSITPSTSLFSLLNTNHGGAVALNLFPVPEPATMALLGLALVLAARRRRM